MSTIHFHFSKCSLPSPPPPPPPPIWFLLGLGKCFNTDCFCIWYHIKADKLLFVIGDYYITSCHSKQFPVGLIVLSDGMVHFLKIDFVLNVPKLCCGFNNKQTKLGKVLHVALSTLKGKFPKTMWIGWLESNFTNPTVKVWSDFDNPFKSVIICKVVDETLPEYVMYIYVI